MNTFFNNLYCRAIDESANRRYSHPQIPDLVAHAIPRFRHPAESYGSSALILTLSTIAHFDCTTEAEPLAPPQVVTPTANNNPGGRRTL